MSRAITAAPTATAPATMTAVATVQTAQEIIAHLNDRQRHQILEDAARATFEGKPLRRYKVFDAKDVLALFRGDRTEDEAASFAMGHPLVATRGEIAAMILARVEARSRPAPDYGIDRDLADALAADDS
jgi:hypothetical protein